MPPTPAVTQSNCSGSPHANPGSHREPSWPPIDAVLARLPAAHRKILVATYFHRQTTEQAARRLGITPAEAKGRLYHAMQNLAAITENTRPAPAGNRPLSGLSVNYASGVFG